MGVEPRNWTDPIRRRINPQAKRLMEELQNFLAEEITAFCRVKDVGSVKMLGAGKYLYTVQNLVTANDDAGDFVGKILPGEQIADHETGIRVGKMNPETTYQIPEPLIGLRRGNVLNLGGGASSDKQGTCKILVAKPHNNRSRVNRNNKGGNLLVSASASDRVAEIAIAVDYKVYAQMENDVMVHHVCIITKETIASARIQFSSKREDGKVDAELQIVDSFGSGVCSDMELNKVSLTQGENMLKIRFNDQMKHALDVNVRVKRS